MKDDVRKFIYCEKAVSETVGYIFLVAIVLLGISILLVIAYPIQSDIQDTASMETQILALTALDGRVSNVAFGSSPSQVTKIDLGGGFMQAQNTSENWLNITMNTPGDIFNDQLGVLEYNLNGNKIAFENGGIFRMYPSGDTLMLSPPEFYTNDETLTFPIFRVNSTGWAGGKGVISVLASTSSSPRTIYPNTSEDPMFKNPIYGKKIIVRLKSDYYQAWGSYIKERTGVVPLVNDHKKEVVVSFNSKPSDQFGYLEVPIEVIGMDVSDETPLNQFAFNFSEVDPNMEIDFRAPKSDSDIFHLNLQKKCGGGTEGVAIVVMYNDGGFNESWESCQPMIINNNMFVDFLNSSVNASYNSNQDSGTWLNDPLYNGTYKKPGNVGPVPLDVLIQHYMKLISSDGTFAIYQGAKTSDKWDGFNATGTIYVLDYDIMPPTINYLHIIDHEVDIGFS
ncbi:MAG: hypothetical protein OIN87_03660 [Candidatus Methanoperedens sp.]|nr:hypothetical protein [Candidatus Methanoperedens sp.]